MSDKPTSEAGAPAGNSAKKKSKLPLLVGGVVLLAAAGGGGYWFLRGAPAAAKEAHGAAPADTHESGDGGGEAAAAGPQGVVAFEPFVVNLADAGTSRFLRVTLKLVIPEEHAVELGEDEVGKARIRSGVLELLALQTADQLVTPEGKDALKHEIAARAQKAMKGLHVTDVLFAEFVVQF